VVVWYSVLPAAKAAEAARQERVQGHGAGTLDAITGEVVSATLDFLSKELVRMTEHKKIAAIVRAAEVARRERYVCIHVGLGVGVYRYAYACSVLVWMLVVWG
jgi:hypothetical protein